MLSAKRHMRWLQRDGRTGGRLVCAPSMFAPKTGVLSLEPTANYGIRNRAPESQINEGFGMDAVSEGPPR